MATVSYFTVPGIEMWIVSGDHEPPHFHARRRGEWSAKVLFLEGRDRMIRATRPPNARVRPRPSQGHRGWSRSESRCIAGRVGSLPEIAEL